MKNSIVLAALVAAVALSACGKKEEVAAPAPAPVTAPAAEQAAAAANQAASAAVEAASSAVDAASAAVDAAASAAQ